jgi:hypothetical protein
LLQNKLFPAKLAGWPFARIWFPLTESGATSATDGAETAIATSEKNRAIRRMFRLSNFMFISPTSLVETPPRDVGSTRARRCQRNDARCRAENRAGARNVLPSSIGALAAGAAVSRETRGT